MIALQLPSGRNIYRDARGYSVQPPNDNWWKTAPTLAQAVRWWLDRWERTYGGRILPDGTLQMVDPNDNCRRRFQYRLVAGQPMRRVLRQRGEWREGPAQWEPVEPSVLTNRGPIAWYFSLADFLS